ncbi:MAG: NAD(P)/FAD-dependent oxidoreductase [Pseudonocardiales bacterium]|nr:NAD(P)/FAD-dependent oxidoreductase [Pseudonocardiales bacterium]
MLIVGTGFAGIAMAIELLRQGIVDFTLVERGSDVGGTWRDNTYPGAACDVPSALYSFSFAPNPNWTRTFSPQPEILDYLRQVAREYGVYEHCIFDAELLRSRWDPTTQRWTSTTSTGEFSSQFLVSAMGALSDPSDPEIDGLADFEGDTFHSARWDHDVELAGRRVAVIGTGASAVQFVPRIAPVVDRLYVHQRTAAWVVARSDHEIGRRRRWLNRHLPWTAKLTRAASYLLREVYVVFFAKFPALAAPARKVSTRHLEAQVADPALREKLRPHFGFGCKRVLISSEFYPSLQRENVELVTEPVVSVGANSITTADGVERPVDVIVFATGFHVTEPPIGRLIYDENDISLARHWQAGMTALRGTTVPGFPNLFLIVGPNTGLGHTSMVYMIESQAAYVGDAIRTIDQHSIGSIDPTIQATAAYNADLQKKLEPSVWNSGGCRSWYLDARGYNSTLWPDFTFRFRRATRRIDLSEYRVEAPVSNS